MSDGDGPALVLWSASRAGSSIADASERIDRSQDEADQPAALLISLGEASEGEDVGGEMDTLLAKLPHVPILLVIAPSGLYPVAVAAALSSGVEQHPERAVLIEPRETELAHPSAEQWALTFHETLTAKAQQG